MRAKRLICLCAALTAFSPAYAQESTAQLQDEIQALKKRITDLEGLKDRLDQLEKQLAGAKSNAASAKSETSAKPATNPLKFSGYIQTRFENNLARNPETDFYLRRAYLKLQADPSPLTSAVLQWDGAGTTVNPLDAYVDFKAPQGGYYLRAGQYKVPFGYETPESPSDRFAPEASRYTNILFPSSNRDRGIYAARSLKGHATFLIGALNGNGINRDNNNQKDYIAHAEIPVGSTTSIGLSGYDGRQTTVKTVTDNAGKSSSVNVNTDRKYYGANFQSQIGPAQIHAEYAEGRNLGAKINGGYVQVALPTPKASGGTPFLKFDWFDPNHSKTKDYFNRWTFGYAYDLDKATRLTLTYEAAKDQATPTKDNITTLQFQVKY